MRIFIYILTGLKFATFTVTKSLIGTSSGREMVKPYKVL